MSGFFGRLASVFVHGSCFFGLAATVQASDFKAHGTLLPVALKVVTTNFSARVLNLPLAQGQKFKIGDSLISFDCQQFNSIIDNAEQQSKKVLAAYSADLKQLSQGRLTHAAADKSFLLVKRSEKWFQTLHQQVNDCDYKAPFDGRLEQVMVQLNQSPASNQSLLRILNTSRLGIEFDVTSRGMQGLEPGSLFSFTIDETGERYEAALTSTAATTMGSKLLLKVYGEFLPLGGQLKPGMTATATFRSSDS
jgi:membrane fusion protein, multidrug efflux system